MKPEGSPVHKALAMLISKVMFVSMSDTELLQRFSDQKDRESMTEIVRRYGPIVLDTARKYVRDVDHAEDVFQSTFSLLAIKADTIQKNLPGWLQGTARNLARELWKMKKLVPIEQEAEMPSKVPPPHEAAVQNEEKAAVDNLIPLLLEGIEQLPEIVRRPIQLVWLEEKSEKQAAEEIGCPLGSIHGRITRGKEKLHEWMTSRGAKFPATALASIFAVEATKATVPLVLMQNTVKTAVDAAAGKRIASPIVAALVKAGLKMISSGSMKGVLLLTIPIASVAAMSIGSLFWAKDGPLNDLAEEGTELCSAPLNSESPPAPQNNDPPPDDAKAIDQTAQLTVPHEEQPPPDDNMGEEQTAQVIRVLDGSTLVLKMNEEEKTVRLVGVDPPKLSDRDRKAVEELGENALNFFRDLIQGQNVIVRQDRFLRDESGQPLAYLYCKSDRLCVNEELIRRGYAVVDARRPFPLLEQFRHAARKARVEGRGLWSRCIELEQ